MAITTTAAEAHELLERCYTALRGRQGDLKMWAAYYDGQHPMEFASAQFRKYWGSLFADFSDNWCSVVVDSKAERLVVKGIRVGQEKADKEFMRVWQVNGLDADSGLAFVDAIAQSRAYAYVWGDPADDDTPVVTFESAHEAIILYEPGSRRKKLAGLKSWVDNDTGTEYATLMLPDSIWKYERNASKVLERPAQLGGSVAGGSALTWSERTMARGEGPALEENPLGEVPMTELPNRARLAKEPVSEIQNVIPLQNAVNIIWSHLITASDFAAFPQRVIMGMEVPRQPIVNDAGEVVGYQKYQADQNAIDRAAVDRVVWLEDPDTKIAQWAAADLSNYTGVIEVAVGHIAAQTRTPQHYLIGKMANLSAEALKAAETGLVATVREKMLYFGEAIREIARLVALAQDNKAKARQMREALVQWQDPESRSDAELADALGKLAVMLHVPDKMLWRRYGFTDAEITEMEGMQEAQQEADLALIKKTADAMPAPAAPPQTANASGTPRKPSTPGKPGPVQPPKPVAAK